VDINVVGESNNGLSADSGMGSTPNSYGQNGGQIAAGGEAGQAKTEEKTDKLSPGQWRSLIANEPTQANVTAMIKAYMAGDLDEASYLAIVGDLFASNKTESQAMGIYAVNYVYSPRAFTMVATSMDKLDATNKSQAQGYLMAYTKTNRLNSLASALQSSDATVVAKAAQVVIAGYEQAKSGGGSTSTDPRPGRGDAGSSSTGTAAYARFVPIFQSLAQSNDATVAGLATSALGQMQTVVAAN
jgi:type IV secretory pathway protease TraF